MRRVHLGIVLLLFLQGLQLGLTLAVATEHAAEAALQVPDRTNREKHPFGSHLSLRRRAWLSMNTPRKELNFCCCLCGPPPEGPDPTEVLPGQTPMPKLTTKPLWYYYEEPYERRCSYDACGDIFPQECGQGQTAWAGSTGLHDPFAARGQLTPKMVVRRCHDVMTQAQAWMGLLLR